MTTVKPTVLLTSAETLDARPLNDGSLGAGFVCSATVAYEAPDAGAGAIPMGATLLQTKTFRLKSLRVSNLFSALSTKPSSMVFGGLNYETQSPNYRRGIYYCANTAAPVIKFLDLQDNPQNTNANQFALANTGSIPKTGYELAAFMNLYMAPDGFTVTWDINRQALVFTKGATNGAIWFGMAPAGAPANTGFLPASVFGVQPGCYIITAATGTLETGAVNLAPQYVFLKIRDVGPNMRSNDGAVGAFMLPINANYGDIMSYDELDAYTNDASMKRAFDSKQTLFYSFCDAQNRQYALLGGRLEFGIVVDHEG